MDITTLRKKGFHYQDAHKKYVGFAEPDGTADVCGFYKNKDGLYAAYITDPVHGTVQHEIAATPTASELFHEILEFAEKEEVAYKKKEIRQELERTKIPKLRAWLEEKHNCSAKKTETVIKCLENHPDLLCELVYLMENHEFVPEKYACTCDGHTAREIFNETGLELCDAFVRMARLKTEI